ncbi:hypothetical protein DV515_00019992, partial [Chloebia gouldiae]
PGGATITGPGATRATKGPEGATTTTTGATSLKAPKLLKVPPPPVPPVSKSQRCHHRCHQPQRSRPRSSSRCHHHHQPRRSRARLHVHGEGVVGGGHVEVHHAEGDVQGDADVHVGELGLHGEGHGAARRQRPALRRREAVALRRRHCCPPTGWPWKESRHLEHCGDTESVIEVIGVELGAPWWCQNLEEPGGFHPHNFWHLEHCGDTESVSIRVSEVIGVIGVELGAPWWCQNLEEPGGFHPHEKFGHLEHTKSV